MFRLPIGTAPKLLLVLFALSGAWILLHPAAKPVSAEGETALRIWVFARTHYDAYRSVIPAFEKAHPGVRVELQQVHGRALVSRLQSAFWADLDAPDLAEVEISSVGTFFRGPLDDIGFLDLNERLKSSGLGPRLVQSRLAPWSTRGHVFGLPHDVHPVMIAYRKDIFDAEGVRAEDLDTWDKFIAAGRQLTRDLNGDGTTDRYMIELSSMDAGLMEPLLFQRGGGYFDANGRLVMDNEVACEVIRWYVPLVAGPDRIANSLGGGQILTQAIENEYLLCLICPDWRSRVIEVDIPRMAGKMALMPLPAFAPGGPRTSTWGGTMCGITRKSAHPDLAWELALHLYYDPGPFNERFPNTNIIPPLKDMWNVPALDEARSYWGGQAIGRLFSNLAEQTPAQYGSPYLPLAKAKLNEAVVECVVRYNEKGASGFDAFVRDTVTAKANEVRKIMERNPFL